MSHLEGEDEVDNHSYVASHRGEASKAMLIN